MKTKITASLVAGGLLVGAGFLTSIVSAPTVASAQETDMADEERGLIGRGIGFLTDVLSELVDEGTIDQTDADAVLGAVEEKAAEIRAEHEAIHELIQQFLEDDKITEAEAAQLPEDHPLLSERFDEAWQDGELTRDELGELRHPRWRAFKRGAHMGALLDDGGIDQEEFSALGDDHPLKQIDVSEYFEDDDLITIDELRELGSQLRAGRPADDTDA